MTVIGGDPVIMLEAPLPATHHALKKAGMTIDDIDLFEVNEAFASVPLAWLQNTGADPARLNVNGGAIALGHPLGASGTRLMATLVHALHARGKRYGLQRHPREGRFGVDDRRRPLHLPSRDHDCRSGRRRRQPRIGGGWPIHEVGRNADVFSPEAGKLLRAGSRVGFPNVHMHANGQGHDRSSRGRVQVPPEGLPAEDERAHRPDRHRRHRHPRHGVGQEDRIVPDALAADQDHRLRTAHARRRGPHVPRRDLGLAHRDAELLGLRPQLGPRRTSTKTTSAPLLPRGTILRVTGYYDNTPANRNVVDPRNWSGLGHRSIDNMNILLMQAVPLTDEKFQEEVTARREKLKLKPGEDAPGCPLCSFEKIPGARPTTTRPRGPAAMSAVSRCDRARPGSSACARRRRHRDRDARAAPGSSREGRQQHHAGLRRLAAERRTVRSS